MKYFFRIISTLFAFGVPIIFIVTNFNNGNLILSGLWCLVLISNIFVFKEIIDLSNKYHDMYDNKITKELKKNKEDIEILE